MRHRDVGMFDVLVLFELIEQCWQPRQPTRLHRPIALREGRKVSPMSDSGESEEWLAGGTMSAEADNLTLGESVDVDTAGSPEPPDDDPDVADQLNPTV